LRLSEPLRGAEPFVRHLGQPRSTGRLSAYLAALISAAFCFSNSRCAPLLGLADLSSAALPESWNMDAVKKNIQIWNKIRSLFNKLSPEKLLQVLDIDITIVPDAADDADGADGIFGSSMHPDDPVSGSAFTIERCRGRRRSLC
jgi:hypothetical protein